MLVNDNALLAKGLAGEIELDYALAHKTLPFKSIDDYVLSLRITWGLMFVSIALIILVTVSRRIVKTHGVSLEQ